VKYFAYDNRKDKHALRLVQFNTRYLYSKSNNCPGNGCDWKNEIQQNEHFIKISKIIKQINPDIINLCEINTSEILNKLVMSLHDNSYNYYMSHTEPNLIDQHMGIVTRVEPLNMHRTTDEHKYPQNSECNFLGNGISNLPKHYISKFFINNMDIIMIGVHLKAHPTVPENCAIREAQAMIIQQQILKYYHNHEIIVIGDFNDFDDDIMDHVNSIPKSKVLDIIKGESGHNPINYKLYNTSTFLHKHERITTKHVDRRRSERVASMIDFVLVTQKLKKHVSDVDIFTQYEGVIGEDNNSDHYPIIVDFDFT
jgi:exonuclease III